VPYFFGDLLLWHSRNIAVEMMISVIYFAMGIIMIFSAGNPIAHESFLDFVIIANIRHEIVMVVYAKNFLHLIVDAIPIGLMGLLPLLFYPWSLSKFLRYRP
jgi:hypothetical protein